MSRNPSTRHLLERGAISNAVMIPITVTKAAVNVCSPPSIAQADIPFARCPIQRNREMRMPSPISFPAHQVVPLHQRPVAPRNFVPRRAL